MVIVLFFFPSVFFFFFFPLGGSFLWFEGCSDWPSLAWLSVSLSFVLPLFKELSILLIYFRVISFSS